jgi:hypothetical protein
MKQQADFSIQDWKSNHFYKLTEGMDNPTPEQMQVLQAIEDMVMAGDTSILDMIKDKMQAEWGDAPMAEAVDIKSMFPAVDQGEMDNDFFIDLFDSLAHYFAANADELDSMDAMGIANHCHQASKAIKGRSSN